MPEEARDETLRQISLFLPEYLINDIDEAVKVATGRKNGRTQWIIEAAKVRLGETPTDERLAEIQGRYGLLNESGKAFIAECVRVAAECPDFHG